MVVMLHRVDQGLTYGKDCGTSAVSTPKIKSAVATSATVVEVAFNVSVDQTAAADKSHYTVTGSPEIPVASVKLTSKDTAEVTLTTAMDATHTYTMTVVDMMTTDGKKFSDSTTFSGYTTLIQGKGSLEVTLSAKNPVGDTVPNFTFQGYFSPSSTTGLATAQTLGEVTFDMLRTSGAKYAILNLTAYW